MCTACREFIKETLTLKEFQSALWEAASGDEEHLAKVEHFLRLSANDPEKLRQKLRDITDRGITGPK